jgi:hypothetical protein
MISASVRNQSIQIFQNIDEIFGVLSNENLSTSISGFPFWKQMYHLLHSMDQNFIDPNQFKQPAFHIKNMNFMEIKTNVILKKEQLYSYFLEIRSRLEKYLNLLDDNILNEIIVFRNMQLTKMELILAQFRHIFYHIGYLHCCLKLLNGETPEYIGLYKAVPEK